MCKNEKPEIKKLDALLIDLHEKRPVLFWLLVWVGVAIAALPMLAVLHFAK